MSAIAPCHAAPIPVAPGTPPPAAGSPAPLQPMWQQAGCGQAQQGFATLEEAMGAPVVGDGPPMVGYGADPATLPRVPAESVPATDQAPRPAGQVIDTIVLHGTNGPANQTGADIVGYWNASPDQASAHYIIDRDGNITQAVPDEQMAFHAGGANDPSMNARSIGIEFVNPIDGSTPPTEEQLDAGRRLIRSLMARYQIHPEGITTHHHAGDPRPGRDGDRFGEDGTFDAAGYIDSL